METMLSALNSTDSLKIKELTVSAIGAIGTEMTDLFLFNKKQQKTQFTS